VIDEVADLGRPGAYAPVVVITIASAGHPTVAVGVLLVERELAVAVLVDAVAKLRSPGITSWVKVVAVTAWNACSAAFDGYTESVHIDVDSRRHSEEQGGDALAQGTRAEVPTTDEQVIVAVAIGIPGARESRPELSQQSAQPHNTTRLWPRSPAGDPRENVDQSLIGQGEGGVGGADGQIGHAVTVEITRTEHGDSGQVAGLRALPSPVGDDSGGVCGAKPEVGLAILGGAPVEPWGADDKVGVTVVVDVAEAAQGMSHAGGGLVRLRLPHDTAARARGSAVEEQDAALTYLGVRILRRANQEVVDAVLIDVARYR
jgi:hypothetical protein